ncbi:MAG: transcription initiation factor TFIIIB [Firmicutes bacterium HGW-Firmicutes-19]|jgi:predicted nucleic-acid-binding Zn-ribbon protein|nr:MAG: transcription initiation factor TFIIIB [Firmicutes bacterium HGW-Firmicutes-19]
MFDHSRICPKCNSTELGEGVFSGHATLMPKGKIFSMGSSVIATVCTRCGYIVELKAKDPAKFIPQKKNRL